MMNCIFIKNCIGEEGIRECLADFFRGQASTIKALDYNKKQDADVFFEANPMKGDYCVNLSIYSEIRTTDKALAVAFCRFFKTEVIISDESLNPYSWILVNSEGEERQVYEDTGDHEEDVFLLRR